LSTGVEIVGLPLIAPVTSIKAVIVAPAAFFPVTIKFPDRPSIANPDIDVIPTFDM